MNLALESPRREHSICSSPSCAHSQAAETLWRHQHTPRISTCPLSPKVFLTPPSCSTQQGNLSELACTHQPLDSSRPPQPSHQFWNLHQGKLLCTATDVFGGTLVWSSLWCEKCLGLLDIIINKKPYACLCSLTMYYSHLRGGFPPINQVHWAHNQFCNHNRGSLLNHKLREENFLTILTFTQTLAVEVKFLFSRPWSDKRDQLVINYVTRV